MAAKDMIGLRKILALLFLVFGFNTGWAQNLIYALGSEFAEGYRALDIPALEYDYHDYLARTPSTEALKKQQVFFSRMEATIVLCKRESLTKQDKVLYDHLLYETENNLERVRLQLASTKGIPEGGLHTLAKEYYTWTIKQYTTIDISPEAVYAMGLSEVDRVKKEIATIQKMQGFTDSVAFYKQLNREEFYITDKQELLDEFKRIDKAVRAQLSAFIEVADIPPVYAMEWPNANANTPPGMYLNGSNNPYGKDVFQFNFFGGRYNKRAMEWLYMHEAIPGHHLQFSLRQERTALEGLFYYPGNFEGWGCYVEYFGKELGLYKDPYSYLGKWEWDLVRSARLVLDAGIHYYGWTREKAMAYWKETIPNQDDIAEREVTRVTNWPGQALSYKVGADKIFELRKEWMKQHPTGTLGDFNKLFLSFGHVPLAVIEKNIFV